MEISVYKTHGIVLKKSDLSDTDRLLTVYTQKLGKILVRAKGIGKKESKLKSMIEPFNVCEFTLAKSKTIDVLAGGYPIKEFIVLRQNLESLALAIYFAELVDKLIAAPERDDKIWALLSRVFYVLDQDQKSPPTPLCQRGELLPLKKGGWGRFDKLKSAFEEKLLEYLGLFRFNLNRREKQNYLQSLAGEEIKSERFLRSLVFTS